MGEEKQSNVQQNDPQQQKKNKFNWGKGCLITLIIVSGLGVLGTVGVVFISAIGLFTGLLNSSSPDYGEKYINYGVGDSKAVLIEIKGEISNSGGIGIFSAQNASADKINEQIQNAIDDPNIVGILIEMDTPGGEIVASDLIYQKIQQARENGLYVVTYMQSLGASGGYYIASASDTILANELTTTGSIGVYMEMRDLSGLYDKLGIQSRIIKHGDFKTGEGLFDNDDSGEEDKMYQSIVDESYQKFLKIVAEGRNMSSAEVENLAEGRVYTGKQALLNGLVDQIGGYTEALMEIEALSGVDNLNIIKYSKSDFWSEIIGVLRDMNINAVLIELASRTQKIQFVYKI